MGWPSLDRVLSRTPRLAYVLIVRVLITCILLYLDAGEACMCGEEPWVQLPSGVWYNEADLQECNLNGDGATDKGGQSSPH